jgi:hypothetical protein
MRPSGCRDQGSASAGSFPVPTPWPPRFCPYPGKSVHTAHEPSSRKVCYQFHPLCGKPVTILRRYPITAPHDVLIVLPDGSRCAIPMWMLDPVFCAELTVRPTPQIAVAAFRALRELVDSVPLHATSTSVSDGVSPSSGDTHAPSTRTSTATFTVRRRGTRSTATTGRPRSVSPTPGTTARPSHRHHDKRKGKK